MPLSERERQLIEQETTAWTDANFSTVDYSAFPGLNSPPPEDRHYDRFARSYGDSALSRSASALRDFVQNPDGDAIAQVADDTGDEAFVNKCAIARVS